MTDLWQRLKQRKLVQWALAYVAFAFALVQGIDVIAQQFGWPEAMQRGITLALVLGFFVTLLLAWYHGERGAQKVTGTELLLLALLLAIGGGLLWKFAPGGSDAASVASAGNAGRQSVSADRHSIAVLPFVNMSGDRNNQYFSDGVSEEILNVLAKIPQLKVAARTSSFSFKGSKDSVPQIARLLGVRMVLEGSVRKQGDRVRITAQLIDARTGYDLWSQDYDRQLKDIFAVQDEIARSVGEELKLRMADKGAGSFEHRGTRNVQAYDLYLRGLSLWQQRTETSLFSAIDDFKKAIARDPKFAQAYAGLALAYAVIPEYSVRIGFSEALEQCRLAAEHALALDPGSADAYAALGNVESAYNRQLELGIAMLDRAIALQPSFATAYQWRGQVLANIGQFNEGLQSLQRARELDPRSLVVAYALAYTYYQMGRYDEAIAVCKPVLSYAPDNVLCPETMGMVYLAQGKNDLARSYFERWSKLRGGAGARDIADLFDVLQGHAGRKALVRRLASTPVRAWYQKGSGYLFTDYEIPALLVRLGDKDAALRFLAADASRFIGFDAILADPHLDTIRCDPRFKAIMSTRGWHDGRAAKLCGRGAPVHTGNTP